MFDRAFDQRYQLLLVTGEAAADVGGTELQRKTDHVDWFVAVDDAALGFRAFVSGGGELPFGEAVDTVVFDDIDHVDAAPHAMRKLAESDRRRVAVARHAHVEQFAVGQICTGQY